MGSPVFTKAPQCKISNLQDISCCNIISLGFEVFLIIMLLWYCSIFYWWNSLFSWGIWCTHWLLCSFWSFLPPFLSSLLRLSWKEKTYSQSIFYWGVHRTRSQGRQTRSVKMLPSSKISKAKAGSTQLDLFKCLIDNRLNQLSCHLLYWNHPNRKRKMGQRVFRSERAKHYWTIIQNFQYPLTSCSSNILRIAVKDFNDIRLSCFDLNQSDIFESEE